MQQCEQTMRSRAEVTPDALARLLEAFSAIGVTREQIERRIQRHIESITPAQIVQLRKIYASLRDGMSVIADWFDAAPAEQHAEQVAAAPQLGTAALKSKLRQRKTIDVSASDSGDVHEEASDE